MEAFGFKGEYSLYLSFDSFKFTILLGFSSGSMQVFIASEPELDGVVDSDGDNSGTPSVCTSFGGCVGKADLFPFQRNVACEEVVPSQLRLSQDCFVMGLGIFVNCDCVGVHPFGQAATNGVCQSFVGVHLLEAFS